MACNLSNNQTFKNIFFNLSIQNETFPDNLKRQKYHLYKNVNVKPM